MSKRSSLRFELLMDAGNGAQKAGDILLRSLAKSGKHIFIEPMIPAEISPPKREPYSLSGVVTRVSSEPVLNVGSDTDFMLVEHEVLLKRRLQDEAYAENCVVFIDMGDAKKFPDQYETVISDAKSRGLTVVPFNLSDEAKEIIKGFKGMGTNMVYLGILANILGEDPEMVEPIIKSVFKKLKDDVLEKNIQLFRCGLNTDLDCSDSFELSETEDLSGSDKILLDGNTAFAMGIIDSGIKLYTGYPITPASTVMHSLARSFADFGGILHQAEDEISAIGSVVGSYFCGVPAITATSGPGVSLMQEFIGLSMGAEVPMILIDVQRGGPSTGLPTRTEQSDLGACVFGAHGDNTKVVIGVADVEDCFYAPHVARYLTEALRLPVIILSDYTLSVSYKVLSKLPLLQMEDSVEITDEVLARFGISRLPKEIEMVSSNSSIPGQEGGMRRVTGLNTDEHDQVMNTSQSSVRSHRIRNEKIHTLRHKLSVPELIGDESGDLLLIGWGTSGGPIEEAVLKARAEGLKVSGLNLKMVSPLAPGLAETLKKFKQVMTAEVAHGDSEKPAPLAYMLRAETLVDVRSLYSSAAGDALKPKDLLNRIKKVIAGETIDV